MMKKLLCALIFFAAIIGMLPAQTVNQNTVTYEFYEVTSDLGAADASLLARELNLMFETFNGLFRFDTQNVPGTFKVSAFSSKEAYDNYVFSKLNRIRDGAIYLHYTNPERRELVVYRAGGVSPEILAHQAFIQFIRGFIANPPSWMRDGFAIYFSSLHYDRENDVLRYNENLAWLETVKSWGQDAPSIESILMADIDGMPANFQPASWALVSFLMNNENEEYRRLLFESFMLLSQNASAADNTLAIMRRISSWANTETLQQDYLAYFAARKTFAGLIEEGRIAYDAKNPVAAEELFIKALEMRNDHYAPYYYLGLLAYEAKNYTAAEQYYRSALQYGADQALLQYAMGLNALSANRLPDARVFLQQAAALSPERYRTRVDELLARME
jgi:tetratricopeptide (TPR) repeat protein